MLLKLSNAVLATAIALLVCGCNPFEEDYIRVCEEQLMDRLKSPSGYKRINLAKYNSKMSIDEYIAYQKKRNRSVDTITIDGIKSGLRSPVHYKAFINYDAPNSFGTLVRSTASCEYVSLDGKTSDVSTLDVLVNGETNHERIMRAVRQQLSH